MIINNKRGIHIIRHAEFTKRLKICLVDSILMTFITLGILAISAGWVQLFLSFATSAHEAKQISNQIALMLILTVMAADVWMFVYLPARFGGTPGTLFFEHRVVMGDARPATTEAIVARHIPVFCLLLLGFGVMWSVYTAPGSDFTRLSYHLCLWTWYIWIFGNLTIMSLNYRHLTISDLLSGTGIVTKESVIYRIEEEPEDDKEEEGKADKKAAGKDNEETEKHWTCIYDDDEEYWNTIVSEMWEEMQQLANQAYWQGSLDLPDTHDTEELAASAGKPSADEEPPRKRLQSDR